MKWKVHFGSICDCKSPVKTFNNLGNWAENCGIVQLKKDRVNDKGKRKRKRNFQYQEKSVIVSTIETMFGNVAQQVGW